MRAGVVAGGLVEGPDGLLLVQNRRRDGSIDWSPPGGVIEVAEGESVLDGLTREVHEETGITVDACGPHLEGCPLWVREPLAAYLTDRWPEPRAYRYRVEGADRASMSVVRL